MQGQACLVRLLLVELHVLRSAAAAQRVHDTLRHVLHLEALPLEPRHHLHHPCIWSRSHAVRMDVSGSTG